MPRYHFNVYDGVTAIDAAGLMLGGLDEAREVALQKAGALMERESKQLSTSDDFRMEITDDHGLLLFLLSFTLIGAPAVLETKHAHNGRDEQHNLGRDSG